MCHDFHECIAAYVIWRKPFKTSYFTIHSIKFWMHAVIIINKEYFILVYLIMTDKEKRKIPIFCISWQL